MMVSACHVCLHPLPVSAGSLPPQSGGQLRFHLQWLMFPRNSNPQVPSDIPTDWLIGLLKVLGRFTAPYTGDLHVKGILELCSLCAWGFGDKRVIHIHRTMMMTILVPRKTTATHSPWKLLRKTLWTLCPVSSELEPRKI